MASTIVGTTMTATAIAGHNKHSLHLHLLACATTTPKKKNGGRQVLFGHPLYEELEIASEKKLQAVKY
jgi:hypothetical protein